MTDENADDQRPPDVPPGQTGDEMLSKASRESQRRELELQLQKIRSEASAARLEAKAAEVELMIRRLSFSADADSIRGDHPATGEIESSHKDSDVLAASVPVADPSTPIPFTGWDDVRDAIRRHAVTGPAPAANDSCTSDLGSAASPISDADHGFTRTDPPHPIRSPRFESPKTGASPEEPAGGVSDDHETDDRVAGTIVDSIDPESLSARSDHVLPLVQAASAATLTEDGINIDAEIETEDDDEVSRSRPGAWLVSTLVHVAILIVLAAIGLTQHHPKDQVALTASASAEQVSMETFEIESSEPESEPTPEEPTPSEVQYELSPVGEISASDLISDAAPVAPSASMAAMLRKPSSAAASMSMKPNSDATMEFCGVKGGGNHFVYLVDSSGSMGDAFDPARAELLRSIDLLKPEQRFYVVFFDAESDYMRLSDANVDEPRSVKASRVNRDALKRWAMRIQKDRGRAPYDALRFALKLRPDVIFLLSDGEFPQGIEDLLKEENRIVNLFGDDDPISIVHTISYYSKEGESRMKRIAQQNQGKYRHVPKP